MDISVNDKLTSIPAQNITQNMESGVVWCGLVWGGVIQYDILDVLVTFWCQTNIFFIIAVCHTFLVKLC